MRHRAGRRGAGRAPRQAPRFPRRSGQDRRRHARQDRCRGRALPQGELWRGGVVAAFPRLSVRGAHGRPDHGPGEGPQPDRPLRRAVAGRRRGRHHRGRGLDLAERLSPSRQLCERRPRLRSLPLCDRPHARGRRGRPPRLDRLVLARPRAASDQGADHRARHAGPEARQGAGGVHPRRHPRRRSCRHLDPLRQCGVAALEESRPRRAAARGRCASPPSKPHSRSGVPL